MLQGTTQWGTDCRLAPEHSAARAFLTRGRTPNSARAFRSYRRSLRAVRGWEPFLHRPGGIGRDLVAATAGKESRANVTATRPSRDRSRSSLPPVGIFFGFFRFFRFFRRREQVIPQGTIGLNAQHRSAAEQAFHGSPEGQLSGCRAIVPENAGAPFTGFGQVADGPGFPIVRARARWHGHVRCGTNVREDASREESNGGQLMR